MLQLSCRICTKDKNSSISSEKVAKNFLFLDEKKPYRCRLCDKAFSKCSTLIIHHRVHTGEKPYCCPECFKTFSISGNLQRHFRIHTRERPHVCPECSRAFNNRSHLTRHRSKLHAVKVTRTSK